MLGRSERRGIPGAETYKMRRSRTGQVPLQEVGARLKPRRLEKLGMFMKVKEKERQVW